MEGENSIVEPIIKEMIDGVITMDTSQGEENDQARATEGHAMAAHSMEGMALVVATAPVSMGANNIDRYLMNSNTNCGERDAQQPVDGGDLEMRVSRTGYLASMIRYDDDTLEDTPGNKPDKLDDVKINPYIDEIPPNTETGVEVFVRVIGRNAISTDSRHY